MCVYVFTSISIAFWLVAGWRANLSVIVYYRRGAVFSFCNSSIDKRTIFLPWNQHNIDYIFLPIGGGGLASGLSTVFKSKVFGSAEQSFSL